MKAKSQNHILVILPPEWFSRGQICHLGFLMYTLGIMFLFEAGSDEPNIQNEPFFSNLRRNLFFLSF